MKLKIQGDTMKKTALILVLVWMALAPAVWAESSLYERLGGEKAITAVVDDFVSVVSSDPQVNFVRVGAPRNWEPTPQSVADLKKHLVQFLCTAAGSKEHAYEGKDMKSAHEKLMITDTEFNAALADLKMSLVKFKVGEKEQKELLGIAESTRGSIVEIKEKQKIEG